MPRFFFNVLPDGFEADTEGSECADIYVAQEEAIRLTGEVIRDLGQEFWSTGQWRLEVTDDRAKVLFIVRVLAEEVC